MSTTAIIALIIFILALVSFVLQKIPAGMTALIASVLMVMTGVLTPNEAFSPYGSDTIMLVLGSMTIGNAAFETGAAATAGKFIMSKFTKSPMLLLVIILSVAGITSAFISNTAVVAIFMPLISSAAIASGGKIRKKDAYMALAIMAVLGGNCTLAGSTPQLSAQGVLEATEGVRILGFWELGKIGWPLVALYVAYFALIGKKVQDKVFDFSGEETYEETQQKAASPKKQIICGVIMLACILGYSTGIYSLGAVSVICGILCVLTGCISFKRACQTMDWNTVMVVASAISLSTGLNKSGVIGFAAEGMINLFGGETANPVALCTALLLLSALLANCMSHTATTAALTPLAVMVALKLGIDPIAFTVAVIIGSSLAFATPINTPALTMTLPAGYKFTDYTISGGLFNVISLVFSAVAIPLIYGF